MLLNPAFHPFWLVKWPLKKHRNNVTTEINQEENSGNEIMFSITPYSALHYAVRIKDGTTTMTWEPCTVIGVDASQDEPSYVAEIRSAAGEFYLKKVDLIRRPEPSA